MAIMPNLDVPLPQCRPLLRSDNSVEPCALDPSNVTGNENDFTLSGTHLPTDSGGGWRIGVKFKNLDHNLLIIKYLSGSDAQERQNTVAKCYCRLGSPFLV